MAEPDAVPPIPARLAGQEAAVAGTQGAIFTAADRKIIEDRTDSPIDRSRTFIEALKSESALTPKVENEVGSNKPETNIKELESRQRDYRHIIKHSAITRPHEHVDITNSAPDAYGTQPEISPAPATAAVNSPPPTLTTEKVALGGEKNPPAKTIVAAAPQHNDIAGIFDQLNEEQKSLSSILPKIRGYHLNRLFTDNEEEFISLSSKITVESLASVRPENRAWLEEQLKKVTLSAAQYKLSLLNSLETMQLDDKHKKTIAWLTRLIQQLEK
ncbi:hypothetical protein HZB07_04700 [Candidatus Saganbacteria bacterium]|nr:hypothetical protein [Candidatus Saganbacteria bacterium]